MAFILVNDVRHHIKFGHPYKFRLRGTNLDDADSVDLADAGAVWNPAHIPSNQLDHAGGSTNLNFESTPSPVRQKRDGDGSLTITLNPSPGNQGTQVVMSTYYTA